METTWSKVTVREGWPETWERKLGAWWYTVEKSTAVPNGWCMGFSHKHGDSDSIDRGCHFKSFEYAKAFCEEHSGVYPPFHANTVAYAKESA